MNIFPRLEARVSAQERRQLTVDARIEELSEDMTASFKQLSEYLGKIEDRFDKVEGDITVLKGDVATLKGDVATLKGDVSTLKGDVSTLKGDVSTLKGDVSTLKGDVGGIKATMATKEDLAAMEDRILDTFKQLLVTINLQRPPLQ